MQVGARDENGWLGTGQHDPLEIGRSFDKLELAVQFIECRAVKNIGGGIRAIERQNANSIICDTPMHEQKNGFRRRGGMRRFTGRHIDPRFHPTVASCQRRGFHSASSHSAAPCPPPTQSETSARFALRRFNSFKLVRTNLAPVAPTGWPRAIAPPFTFNFSRGIAPNGASRHSALRANLSDSIALSTDNTCAAKASLISMRSAWPRVNPVCASSL